MEILEIKTVEPKSDWRDEVKKERKEDWENLKSDALDAIGIGASIFEIEEMFLGDGFDLDLMEDLMF